jgi:hypothetical protein
LLQFKHGMVVTRRLEDLLPSTIGNTEVTWMESEIEQIPVPDDDYEWTTGSHPQLVHHRRIAAGAFGEVHEVA